MFVYFDRNGTLKEIITEQPFRNGDSERDKIYVYLEDETLAYNGWIKYLLPDGTETTETQFYNGNTLNKVGKELPLNPPRNLKYFNYEHIYTSGGQTHTGYLFYEITVPDEVLNSAVGENNMVIARIRFINGSSIFTLGAVVFSVESNIGILTDTSINETQYNYLLKIISDYTSDISNKADLTNATQVFTALKVIINSVENLAGNGLLQLNGDALYYNLKKLVDLTYLTSTYYDKTQADNLFALISQSGYKIVLNINNTNFKISASLYDKNNNLITTSNEIDLPVESAVVGGSYNAETKTLVLTLQSGNTIEIPVGDLISGLQTEINAQNKLNADYVDDTNSVHKFVSAEQIAKINVAQLTTNLVQSVRSIAEALTDKYPSEKAVRIELDTKQDKTIPSIVINGHTYTNLENAIVALNQFLAIIDEEVRYLDGSDTSSIASRIDDLEIDKLDKIISITYADLVALRGSNGLRKGQQYRITDYEFTYDYSKYAEIGELLPIYAGTNVSSAGHQFDIIVVADDVNVLNENARAIQHSGDTYFEHCDLSAWELKYSLDNSDLKMPYANATNGKGVIFYMKDEFNNECPYDFKNLLFTREDIYTNAYTFTETINGVLCDASMPKYSSSQNWWNADSRNNVIKANPVFNVFYTTSQNLNSHNNYIKRNCQFNTLGNYNEYNELGEQCGSIVFGTYVKENKIGASCSHITLGNYCEGNNIGAISNYITMGNSAYNNTFIVGNNIILGNNCNSNFFGAGCNNITFGDKIERATFGSGVSYVDTTSVEGKEGYYRNFKIDNWCAYIHLTKTESDLTYVQNFNIHLGIRGTENSYKTISLDMTYDSVDIYPTNHNEITV